MNDKQLHILDSMLKLIDHDDAEHAHVEADNLMVQYIQTLTDETRITEAYMDVRKWYA